MMKVKELIKKLKCYNPDARVVAEYRDDDEVLKLDYFNFVDWQYDEDGKTNKNYVVIS
tara:strand:+ start:425 stop:598 length:174 start_codon:yes stop_codon:yes gene_type:complete